MGNREIPEERLNAAGVIPADKGRGILAAQFDVTQSVEELVGEIGRLLQVLVVEQAKAAMERRHAWAGLLEDVGERPIRHRRGGGPDVADLVHHVFRSFNIRLADIQVVYDDAPAFRLIGERRELSYR